VEVLVVNEVLSPVDLVMLEILVAEILKRSIGGDWSHLDSTKRRYGFCLPLVLLRGAIHLKVEGCFFAILVHISWGDSDVDDEVFAAGDKGSLILLVSGNLLHLSLMFELESVWLLTFNEITCLFEGESLRWRGLGLKGKCLDIILLEGLFNIVIHSLISCVEDVVVITHILFVFSNNYNLSGRKNL